MKSINSLAFAMAIAAPVFSCAAEVSSGARNIVLVPGAFVDGSSMRQIHDQLWLKGYKVTVAQQPHTTLDENVQVVRQAIEAQDGPVVLVGHGVGGVAISIAGTRDKVKALVYIAAAQTAVGESWSQLTADKPGAAGDYLVATRDGHIFIDPPRFREVFAADVPELRTNFASASQSKVAQAVFNAYVWGAAWRNKPSYGIVATEDRILNPELQRWMYKRAGSNITEIKGSHAVIWSQPEEVAKVIIQAALNVK